MPFHHLYNLIKRSQIKIKAVGTPCRNLLHIIRAGNQAFPRLTIIFRTLPRNKPVLLRIMIPEKNSSFIQSYPNIGLILLKPKLIIIIPTLNNILSKNNTILFIGKNNSTILTVPSKLANINLYNFACLFSITETLISNNKS